MKPIQFLNQFLENKKVGAVMPSSRYLVREMIKPIDFSKAHLIVEYGPGHGNITKEILKKMLPDAKLLVFEINPPFIEELEKIKDNRLHIYAMGA
ncbi:MAG TPA: hypothetical protein DCQ93_07140, partial [Bacteroidetes bacterium]|nr:hypothetical protein [Bacteroidota bacterium]